MDTERSGAREYTCDRYGCAAAGDRDGALLGLTILAAGGAYGRQVNRESFVQQRDDMRGSRDTARPRAHGAGHRGLRPPSSRSSATFSA